MEEKAAELLSPETIAGLADGNWKTRLSAMEQFSSIVRGLSRSEIPTQALVRTLVKKPGLKENNFQVLKLKLEVLTYLASNSEMTRQSARYVLDDLAEKIGDSKNGEAAAEALTAIAEVTKLESVSCQVRRSHGWNRLCPTPRRFLISPVYTFRSWIWFSRKKIPRISRRR